MQRIVFLDRSTVIAPFTPLPFEHEWVAYDDTRAEEVADRIQGAHVVITNKVRLGPDVLAHQPSLKLVVAAATGVDHVDLEACRQHGIAVANARNYATASVVEHTFLLLLALRRNFVTYRQNMERGEWAESGRFSLFDAPIHQLSGSTLAIVGHGTLGKAVAAVAEAFGMRVLIAEHKGESTPRAGRVPFDEALASADVLSLHCPATPRTIGMIGEAELRAMQPHALLINTARGALVDEPALARALAENRIGGAGLDVLSVEPPPKDHPLLGIAGANFILTPHQAWASREAMQCLAEQIHENICAFVDGRPVRLVGG